MKANLKQAGSAHIVIVIVLVIALIGALGFVFWQNFINKSSKMSNNTVSKQVEKPSEAVVDTSKDLSQTQCFTEDTLCFKYPKEWSVTSATTSGWEKTDIKNKAGINLVTFNVQVSGIGGTGISRLKLYVSKVTNTTILASSISSDTRSTVAVLGGVINDYVTESDAKDNGIAVYNEWYPMAYLASNSANVQAGQVIDSDRFAPMTGFIAKTVPAGFEAGAGSNGASVTWPTRYASKEEALKAYASDDFQTAFEILQSTYYK